jgi:septal ring factor EnvC (AmiA/AmiB activator)
MCADGYSAPRLIFVYEDFHLTVHARASVPMSAPVPVPVTVQAKSAKNADTLKVKLEKTRKELQEKAKLAESLDLQLKASLKEKEHLERTYKQSDSAVGVKVSVRECFALVRCGC